MVQKFFVSRKLHSAKREIEIVIRVSKKTCQLRFRKLLFQAAHLQFGTIIHSQTSKNQIMHNQKILFANLRTRIQLMGRIKTDSGIHFNLFNPFYLCSMFLVVLTISAWRIIDLNQAIFSEKMQLDKGVTKAETVIIIAKSFAGNPYVSHTLEQTPEKLVCNLSEFDCYTFVESVLAMTLARHHQKSYLEFQTLLRQMRYRDGKLEGYGSRLHYFWEWKQQGQAMGWYFDVTEQLGGTKAQPVINFMTTHRGLYPALEDETTFQEIQRSEKKLSENFWHYLPKSKVGEIETHLQEGDIVGITSGIAGLDFNHEGFIVKKGNQAYLLHASSDAKKVMVSTEPLADYLQKIKKHSGIVVLRIKG
ncbi:MAG: N-acetylmuramoyl-L-alanine amidase-like domain-containing protein [Runella sp.]|uniref:N-acetylmuramoyl-L-alanine amidase-like domain-containing protein n=2 Tax=Runella sp. TaxID=1960881 RepID=UPI0026339078|nr:N-acetylmuramoyl-L-alanine amidase-like domain-containing protein [Runella sp.]